MRPTLLMLLFLCASTAMAWDPGAGMVYLSGDDQGESCSATVEVGDLLEVHVFIEGGTDIYYFEFGIELIPGLYYDYHSMVTGSHCGPALEGAVFFDSCVDSPGHVMTYYFYIIDEIAPCTLLPIIPIIGDGPQIEQITSIDCDLTRRIADGRGMILNPTPDCADCGMLPVADETSSWGQIKAMYSD